MMQLPQNYNVIRRNVKHCRLRVNEDCTVDVIIPNDFSDDEINSLILKKQLWIEKNLAFFKNKSKIVLGQNEILLFGNRYCYYYNSQFKKQPFINDKSKIIQSEKDLLDKDIQIKWLKGIAKKYIPKRTMELSQNLNLPYSKLYIRNQKRKWGNCTSEKNISINWKLIKSPKVVIDYVIVHELCHTLIMNHSREFDILLKSNFPDYQEAQNWLDKYGNCL